MLCTLPRDIKTGQAEISITYYTEESKEVYLAFEEKLSITVTDYESEDTCDCMTNN